MVDPTQGADASGHGPSRRTRLECAGGGARAGQGSGQRKKKLTVDVMSAEQTSQTYLTPPSPPLAAVFFLMTPMVAPLGGHTMHTRAGRRIIRGERGDAALIEPEPPSGRLRRERTVQRASVNGGRGRHSGATRSLMDLRDGGWQLDGIVVARCWLEGESQQLSSKWLARHGLLQVAGACIAGVYPADRTVAEPSHATNAPLSSMG